LGLSPEQFRVESLGARAIPSPLKLSHERGDGIANYVYDDTYVLYQVTSEGGEAIRSDLRLEVAGPRENIFFNPADTRAAMVTCGGLSPGLNNVIRSMYFELHYKYQAKEVLGFQYGYRGINPARGLEPITITPEFVRTIHNEGGSVLGCSRGAEETSVIVDRLQEMGLSILFCIGGDGTLKGAHAIAEEVRARGARIAIVGVPKTIDNDIPFVYKTFGFDTAVGVVREAIQAAHTEAVGTQNGIGLVKVMGRDSGFIAAYGTLASTEVNYCLIPEVPFDLHGEGGLLDLLDRRIRKRGHAVIVVAEGAGQELFKSAARAQDESGNILHSDIGVLLRDEINAYFKQTDLSISLKYIDPSYMIRSVRADANDAVFCDNLARNAVHAGMAGKTDLVIGLWHGLHVHVPVRLAISSRKKVNPESNLWRNVTGATGQPLRIGGEEAVR
jgi:6-phosphofructokinase 1